MKYHLTDTFTDINELYARQGTITLSKEEVAEAIEAYLEANNVCTFGSHNIAVSEAVVTVDTFGFDITKSARPPGVKKPERNYLFPILQFPARLTGSYVSVLSKPWGEIYDLEKYPTCALAALEKVHVNFPSYKLAKSGFAIFKLYFAKDGLEICLTPRRGEILNLALDEDRDYLSVSHELDYDDVDYSFSAEGSSERLKGLEISIEYADINAAFDFREQKFEIDGLLKLHSKARDPSAASLIHALGEIPLVGAEIGFCP